MARAVPVFGHLFKQMLAFGSASGLGLALVGMLAGCSQEPGIAVVGKKVAGVTVDPAAVPWLLLQGVSHSSESGRFDDVTSIQRLSTVGGNAPTDGCDATHVGAIAQVPYSTDYVFYRAKPKGSVQQCGG